MSVGLFALGLLAALVQLAVLLVAAPFLTDVQSAVQVRLSEQRFAPLNTRWRQLLDDWRRPAIVDFGAWGSLILAVGALAVLPLATIAVPLARLADPLAVGLMLLGTRLPTWLAACRTVSPRRRHASARLIVVGDWHAAMAILPLLVLTSALLSIGLPGADGLSGLVRDMRLQSVPALTGALVFAALALLVLLQAGLLCPTRFETLIPDAEGRARGVRRYAHDVATCGWLLLLADLASPGLIAVGAPGTFAPDTLMDWCVALPRLFVVVLLAAAGRALMPHDARRKAAILAGAAILLVMAGRLST